MLENGGGGSGGRGGNRRPQLLNFHDQGPSSHLLSTYYVQAPFSPNTHNRSTSSTAGSLKVEFQAANPLGRSPVLVSRGPGTRGPTGSLRSPPSELPSSAPHPRSPWPVLAWVTES